MKKQTLFALGIVLVFLAGAGAARALSVPEKLVYEVSWSGVRAGRAVQEANLRNGELALTYTVRSSGLINTFFPIDDRSEALLAPAAAGEQIGLPRLFREKISEGKTRTDKEAVFDQQRLTVETKDFLKHSEKSDVISSRTFDTLSCIYFIRASELIPGKPVHFDVFDLKRLWKAQVSVLRHEEVRTPVGRFPTLVVRAQLSAEGMQPRNDYMTVWLSDDSRRIPVKLSVKLKVGEFTATLVGGSYWPS
jgi:hypothetical protein